MASSSKSLKQSQTRKYYAMALINGTALKIVKQIQMPHVDKERGALES